MEYVLTAEEMQRLDRVTIEDIGLPGAVLMETAGRAIARAAHRELAARPGGARAARVAVVCGGGNNGGDGFVVARCLREWGARVTAYLAAAPDRVRGDAAVHYGALERAGGAIVSVADDAALADHREAILEADIVVDAVFGTGLSREVTGHYRRVLEVLAERRGPLVAADIPSGLSADTGEALGPEIRADVTVTMAFRKAGIAAHAGFERAGRVEVAEIGIPRRLAAEHGARLVVLEGADLAPSLPAIAPGDHKFRRGHVAAVAGAPGTRGAARLTALAALRSGAGLATIASPWRGGEVWAEDPVMTADLDPDADDAAERLAAVTARADALAIGPGMPTSDGGAALVRRALATARAPIVLDADGLNQLAPDTDAIAEAVVPVILTPHPGEAARLLSSESAEIQRDRVAAARRLAEATRAVVVLKGARTLVCDGAAGDGVVTINPTGGPALATAGSGDVLAGVIAALVGQGARPADAARLGCYLHGCAGDRAAEELGPRAVTASDVIDRLAFATSELARLTTAG